MLCTTIISYMTSVRVSVISEVLLNTAILHIHTSYIHKGSTGNETWSHRYRRSGRWPLENKLNLYLFYAYNRKESMDEGFIYSDLAIVHHSRWHVNDVIGDFRRPALA